MAADTTAGKGLKTDPAYDPGLPNGSTLSRTSSPSAWVQIQQAIDHDFVVATNTGRALRNYAIQRMSAWGKLL